MTRQFSPLGFETGYQGIISRGVDKTKFLLKLSETDVAIAWADGYICSYRTTYQEHTLTQGYYFDNLLTRLTPGGFVLYSYSIPLSMAVWGDFVYILHADKIVKANKHKKSIIDYGVPMTQQQIDDGFVFVEPDISVPAGTAVGSPLYAAYGKLWLVSTEQDGSMRNLLHIYDIAMQTWSFVSIPGRHQYIERRISDDYDGNIIITNMNDHGVVIFNAFTNTHVKSIKVNRHTYGLARNENKVLYVMSDKQNQALVSSTKSDAELVDSAGANAGLFVMEKPSAESTSVLSQIDIAAGTATAVGTAMGLDYVMDDLRTGYRWTVGGPVGWRILSTSSAETAEDDTKALAEQLGLSLLYKSAVETPGDLPSDPANNNPKRYDTYFCTEDSQLYSWKYPGNVRIKIATQAADESVGIDCIQGVMTNQFTYDRYDAETDTVTSSTVRPFLFLRTETGVVAYRLTSLIGVNSSEVLGTAMIAIGPQAYIGD